MNIPSTSLTSTRSNTPRLGFLPVIIIGAARSGTNMLRDLLTAIPGVATWPCDEINYIWRHYNLGASDDELQPSQATPRVQHYIRRAFSSIARPSGARIVLEKTCANSLRVDFVRAVIPEAKFLFLIRDGRDAVTSAIRRWKANVEPAYLMRKARFVPPLDLPFYALRYASHRIQRLFSTEQALPTWGPRFRGIDRAVRELSLEEVCALQWKHSVEKAASSLSQVSPSNVCQMRYEHITSDPIGSFQQICDWIGHPAEPKFVRDVTAQVSKSSSARWVTEMNATTLKRIEGVCGETLERFGYARSDTMGRRAA